MEGQEQETVVPQRIAESIPDIRMSNKVRIQRWNGPLELVLGPSLIIIGLQKAAEALAISGFMRPWIVDQIKAHLESGASFKNVGKEKSDDEEAIVPNGQVIGMRVKSEYCMATEQEVLDYVDHEQFANVTGHAVTRRAQEKTYILMYHEGPDLIEAYDRLPRQAKVVLDILNEAGRDNFSEASIEVLVTEAVANGRLVTRQEPMLIFGFYRHRFVDEGHLQEVE